MATTYELEKVELPLEPQNQKVRKEDVEEVFEPLIYSTHLPERSQARRAILAKEHGGRCIHCKKEIDDYADFGRDAQPRDHRFEFDHIWPREYEGNEVSPVTGIKQFVISGTNLAKRNWNTAYKHCMTDTRLLCRNCHYWKTKARAAAKIYRQSKYIEEYYTMTDTPLPSFLSGGNEFKN